MDILIIKYLVRFTFIYKIIVFMCKYLKKS